MPDFKKQRELTVFAHPFSAAYWRAACAEVKNLRTLMLTALIVAIRIVLKRAFIPVGDSLSIYIGFVFTALGGSVYGPVLALIAGTITDLIGFVIAPTGPFNPMFTLIEAFTTFLYAFCLYRQKITFGRLVLAKLSVNVLGNIIANSVAMGVLYGKGVYYYLIPRILKNIVMLPFEVVLLGVVFGALIRPMIRLGLYSPQQNALAMKKSSYVILALIAIVILAAALAVALNYDACKTAFKAFADSLFHKT